MPEYAGIIIDISHEKLDRPFHYRIPERFREQIVPGTRVLVPFGKGNRVRTGYVIELTDQTAYDPEKIKEIIRPDDSGTTIESDLIALAAWIRDRFGGTMNQALKTVLPVHKKTGQKESRRIYLCLPREEAVSLLAVFRQKHQTARARLLEALLEQSPYPYERAAPELRVSAAVIRGLEEKGVLRVEHIRSWRNPVLAERTDGAFPGLNAVQQEIADGICRKIREGDRRPVLIYGVTGSGKTEVYMELIARTVAEGKQAIVLIPEIALTYQTQRRFCSRFGSRVSVINSRMSDGEKYDQFERARQGDLDVMIGPRSAVFTPFPNLGLIVVDEEHESAYKSEQVPRYHARDVAIRRAEMCGGSVILGSATPSVDSYSKAREGSYHLWEMRERVERRPLPTVYTEDMRQELQAGNRSILSRRLRDRIEDRLGRGEQIMLFLNRRGVAGSVICRTCGSAVRCPHCEVSMSMHSNGTLVCHYCGHRITAPKVCPSCGSPQIGGFRAGTQKAESYIRREFPQAGVLRMDYDTTRRKGDYEKILSAFARQEADILIGTQMIVKGHDFPAVTLVGVLAADLSLNLPDYHASERTFQLLTQAAGRAGRGQRAGEVVIQTYQPEHYAVAAAARQNYQEFYRQEILYRRLMHYPPVWHLLLIHAEGKEEPRVQAAVDALFRLLQAVFHRDDPKSWQIVGPADASVSRVRDRFRKQIYVKHEDLSRLIAGKNRLEQQLNTLGVPADIHLQMDLNPMNMM
jgi:primosomal protein N' (replication factor Y)